MYQKLEELIKKYENIIIYRHEFADPDALGSQFGLKVLLEDNYQKKVYAVGKNVKTLSGVLFPLSDEVSEEIIKKSLVIVLDTANSARIDDGSYELGKEIVKIDHHPLIEKYATYSYVDTKACATSYLIGEIAQQLKMKMSSQAATYIYAGIIGDTGRFLHDNTNADVFALAAYLCNCGANIQDVYEQMYSRTIAETKLTGFILKNFVVKERIAYYILEEKDYLQYDLAFEKAKEYVNTLASIDGVDVWTSCTYNPETGFYHVSLRSRKVVVNTVAQDFGGGGHKFAAGLKVRSLERFNLVIETLIKNSSN